jgi:TIR domain
LHGGDPLIDDLQAAITESTHFLLLWSKPASESRYVKAEWQAAYDLEKVIISCLLDKTPLPLFLRRLKFCDMRGSYLRGWREIIGALQGESPRPKPKLQAKEPEKQAVIDALYRGQQTVLEILETGDLARAKREQEKLEPVMNDALRRWRSDDVILNLGGYQLKIHTKSSIGIRCRTAGILILPTRCLPRPSNFSMPLSALTQTTRQRRMASEAFTGYVGISMLPSSSSGTPSQKPGRAVTATKRPNTI